MVGSSILLKFATVHYPSTKLSKYSNCTVNSSNTINVERFAGLNIRGFSPVKFFTEIFLRCLGQQYLLFNYSSVFTGKLSQYS